MFSRYFQLVCFYVVFVMVWHRPAVSFSTIRYLPGFSAPLPFKLETGYIGVGDVEFFYYFIESERNPAEDPLILWLTGGPGCTALSGLFLEIGIKGRDVPAMNLKGYLLGNPRTDQKLDDNSQIPFYHRMALISDELYESAKRNCKEEYIEEDISNVKCAEDLQAISECTVHVNKAHILEPDCPPDFKPWNSLVNNRKYFLETHEDYLRVSAQFPQFGCCNYNCYLCKVWATDISVQKALRIREGTVREWVRCNRSLHYDFDVPSAVGYHLYLNTKGYRALIYSGDHDACFPYIGTESWIKLLNFSIADDWRPWFVDGQVAGYSREYENNFTFATIKGGGHTAPEFNPKERFAMFK